MKVAVATISFGDENDRRIVYWYGDDGEEGQLYLENEDLEVRCFFDQAREKVKSAYPEKIWDLELIDSFLAV